MTAWIDAKSLRASLSFAQVLTHYQVQARIKGDRAYALCPLPTHRAQHVSSQRTASLSIHLTRNLFQCFGCKAAGNVLDFCMRMEGFDPADPKQFRPAALKIAETFGVSPGDKPRADRRRNPSADKPPATTAKPDEPTTSPSLTVIVNAALDFELKHLDPGHPYLSSRGLTRSTIDYFGLGYCGKGMMKGRIAIPVHDAASSLVGYAGRLAQDSQVDDETPKYLFPGPREREGKRFEFHKSRLVYNLHRINRPVDRLIVVEGFASVWWMHQHGFPETVALMGSTCSVEQAKLLVDAVKPAGHVWIVSDGDDAGDRLASGFLPLIARHRAVYWRACDSGRQPTDLTAEELAALPRPV